MSFRFLGLLSILTSLSFPLIFINNEWCNSEEGVTFPTINPTTEKEIVQVEEGRTKDIDKAVKAAKEAFKFGSEWRTLDASKRGLLLQKLADLIELESDYIANVEALDNGKSNILAQEDIGFSVKILRYYAGFADKINGVTTAPDGDYISYTRIEPVGVVGAIIPWNYPFMLAIYKLAPAIAAGCTIVVKPAEQTPLTALILADLVLRAGFPKGVVNIVPGYGPTAGGILVQHPNVDKITFTGSTEIGHLIMKCIGESSLKRVTLELGGKSPLIIFADAENLDTAATLAHEACMANQGQCCVAGSRTFVEASIYDTIIEKLKHLAENRIIGDPFDPNTVQGPQIDSVQFNRIIEFIESGKKEGATLVTGGQRVGEVGYFIQPTVFGDVKDDMRIAKEEIFGPVQSVFKFNTIEEVIARANNSTYGLGAGVFTSDINKALMMTQALQAGSVWVNCYDVGLVTAPFGGFKNSGFGREFGQYGIEAYTEIKSVTIAIPQKNS